MSDNLLDEVQKDDDALLLSYLNRMNHDAFKPNAGTKWHKSQLIQLIFNTNCNQNCAYCYLMHHNSELYPTNLKVEEYIERLHILLNFCKEQHIYIHLFNFFAGNILWNDLLYKALDELYDYADYIVKNCDIPNASVQVLVPVNTTGLLRADQRDRLLQYQQKFKPVGSFNISISTDGLFAIDTRENNNKLTQESYDEIFAFAEEIKAGFHPMISPQNVEHGIENLLWWNQQYIKYNREEYCYPMYLHVRDDGWTQDKINYYLAFLDTAWSLRFKSLDNDKTKMAKYIFGKGSATRFEGFDPVVLPFNVGCNGDSLKCNIQQSLYIDLNSWSIAICQRLAYPQFKQQIIIENNKIIGVHANNITAFLAAKNFNPLVGFKCSNCDYRFFCNKGCLGAQYEFTGEMMLPIQSVCNLEKARIHKIIRLAYTSGVLDTALEDPDIMIPSAILESIKLIMALED